MRVTWFTESPRDWRSPVAGFFVLVVVLLGISAPPVCVDRCHGEEQGDCRAEQVRPDGSLAPGPCSGQAGVPRLVGIFGGPA